MWFYCSPLSETWNRWMTIYPGYCDFVWKNCQFLPDFTWNHWNYMNYEWTWIHDIELKWNVILWNAKNCFWAWVFRECEFTDPSLKNTSSFLCCSINVKYQIFFHRSLYSTYYKFTNVVTFFAKKDRSKQKSKKSVTLKNR